MDNTKKAITTELPHLPPNVFTKNAPACKDVVGLTLWVIDLSILALSKRKTFP